MLAAQQLICVRGERTLFSGLDFDLHPGELLHVRGANGAGKTSLLRLIVGLSAPAGGTIFWNGLPVKQQRELYAREMLYLGHQAALKSELTAMENLTFSAAIDGVDFSPPIALQALGRLGLRGREHFPVDWFSAGQRRRALLARLALRKATLWVLDEPFNALDVNASALLLDMLSEHLRHAGMVVMTSHQEFNISNMKVLSL